MAQINLKNLDWLEVLTALSSFATSALAKEQLENLSPANSQSGAEKSFEQIHILADVLRSSDRPFAESLDYYKAWHSRLEKKAVLKPLEFKDIRLFCQETLVLKQILSAHEHPWTQSVAAELMNAVKPLNAIDALLSPRGEIRKDASETLAKLFQEKEQLARQIQSHLDNLVKDNQIEPVLQEKFVTNREGRWVVPVKSGMQHQFQGIIHAASQSKQTVFMEPESIVPMNNRVRQVEVLIEEEIERLLKQLSLFLSSLVIEFAESFEILLKLDIAFAKAQLTVHLNAQSPTFSPDEIRLDSVRHPSLALLGQKVVSNDVVLNAKSRILLLSGPNAGGKTVLLKSIGLAAQMASCGLPICAQASSKIPFFRHILVAVGDSQNVDMQLSTFAGHIKILNQAARLEGKDQLVLIDEICGSTDPEEGSALARAFIERFEQNQIFATITSHLGPLKSGWSEDSTVVNGSMEYNSKTGLPTYRFIRGVAGESMAIQTAERVGVEPSILDATLRHLSPESRARRNSLSEIEALKRELIQTQSDLKQKITELNTEKTKYQEAEKQFSKERDKLLAKEQKKAEARIDEMITEVKVENIFEKQRRLEQIKTELPQVIKASSVAQGNSNQQVSDDFCRTPEEFVKRFPPGSKVFVPKINQDGIVQGEPNQKGDVPILSQSIRLFLPYSTIKPSRSSSNPTAKILRNQANSSGSRFDPILTGGTRSVDLRGKKVDDAIELLEEQLDVATKNEEDRIKIIHGHGTDALKKAVRSYLSRSLYVYRWTAGSPSVGGDDGITLADLKS